MVLSNNQLINIILEGIESVDNEIVESVDYSFSTTFTPLYSTPNRIRAIAGSYLQDISDEMLLYLIHTFSVEADNLSICNHDNFSKWNYYAGQWVAYNAALEAVMNSNFYVNNAGKKTYKKLGDFAISKDNSGNNSSPSDAMIKKLECEILKLSVSVKFCKEPLTSCDKGLEASDLRNGLAAQLVIKGESQPRPMIGRTFYSEGRYPGITGFIKFFNKNYLTNYHLMDPRYPDENGRYQ